MLDDPWCSDAPDVVRWSSPLVSERLPEHLLEALPFTTPGRSATHLGIIVGRSMVNNGELWVNYG